MSRSSPRRNWAGNVTFEATEVHKPGTVDELRRIVAAAHRVPAVGSGHSFSRVADMDGVLVDLSGLPPHVAVDDPSSQVTVGAGITFAQVLPKLHAAGAAPAISAGSGAVTRSSRVRWWRSSAGGGHPSRARHPACVRHDAAGR